MWDGAIARQRLDLIRIKLKPWPMMVMCRASTKRTRRQLRIPGHATSIWRLRMATIYLEDLAREIAHEYRSAASCTDTESETLVRILYERLEQFALDVRRGR